MRCAQCSRPTMRSQGAARASTWSIFGSSPRREAARSGTFTCVSSQCVQRQYYRTTSYRGRWRGWPRGWPACASAMRRHERSRANGVGLGGQAGSKMRLCGCSLTTRGRCVPRRFTGLSRRCSASRCRRTRLVGLLPPTCVVPRLVSFGSRGVDMPWRAPPNVMTSLLRCWSLAPS